jgi:uncharacterized membrane protein YeaQ/YmgE (transglycosylase-associated protein family)
MTMPGLATLVVIVCGAFGKANGGGTPGGLIVSVVVGLIRAFAGPCIAQELTFQWPLVIHGHSLPVLWSIIGWVVFNAFRHLVGRPR